MRVCALIPVYDHAAVVGATVAGLRRLGLPVLLVDDGSGPACRSELERLAGDEQVFLERFAVNCGKGAAIKWGLRVAAAKGFSHALQIDADGQHDPADVPVFLAASSERPLAVINGCAYYDESVPRARHYGRYVTHVWVWINTLSLSIPDSMCGLRLYPLASVVPLLKRVHIGDRMEFDTEILVRMFWAGIPVHSQPARVRYPRDGVSHFRLWRDNVRISAMHARLFLGMLPRAPRLLLRRLRRTPQQQSAPPRSGHR